MVGCAEDPPQVCGQKLNVKPGIMVMQFCGVFFFFSDFILEKISATSFSSVQSLSRVRLFATP